MHNLPSNIQNLKSKIPTVLPLPDAASKYGLTEQALTQLIQTGKIDAVQLPSGEILVPAENDRAKTKEQIVAEKFAHLRGRRISASEASRKYSEEFGVTIPQQNFSRWAEAGYIEVLERGYRLQLNEADVAYCASTYAEKYAEYGGQMQGVNIFDKEGNPYQIKYGEIAEQKRAERRAGRVRSVVK